MISRRKKIAVFASGFGSNFQAINDYIKNKGINGYIGLLFSNNPGAYALQRAEKDNIATYALDPKDFNDRKEYDQEIAKVLKKENIDIIVLAGYMLLFTPGLVNLFKNRIINIHPSLLPAFKGTQGIKDAYDYGVKVTGVTVHFVDAELDHGPIILQKEVAVNDSYSLKDLEERIHQVEHDLYPKAVEYLCSDRLQIKGRKVIIREKEV